MVGVLLNPIKLWVGYAGCLTSLCKEVDILLNPNMQSVIMQSVVSLNVAAPTQFFLLFLKENESWDNEK
jgi:hypothetical protein